MKAWWARLTPEQKRAKTARRNPDLVREQARRKQARRRAVGTPEQKLKIQARAQVRLALARGDLERGPCEVCGATGQAHHDDYARPLDVRWLCREHHVEHHGQEIAG